MNKITIKPVESEELKVKVKTVPLNPVQVIGENTFNAYHSKVWAEGSDEEVAKLGGEHSSKGWSEVTKGIAEQAEQDISEQTAKSIEEIKEQENLSLTNITNQEQESLQNLRNQETDSISNIENAGTETIGKVIEEGEVQISLATEQAGNASTSASTSESYASEAASSAARCEEIFQRIGTAIKIKGRVDRLEDLPMVGNLDGDAYLVGAEGLDSYPEYYWYQNHWEFLGTSGGGGTWGTITGDITTQTDLQNALDSKQEVGDYATNSDLQQEIEDRMDATDFLGQEIMGVRDEVRLVESTKQNKLTAGNNISIENDTISVTGDLGAEIIIRRWD